jgi:hypothetical protein
MVNTGPQVTTLSLVKSIVTKDDIFVQFDGRLDSQSRRSHMEAIEEAKHYMKLALMPLLIQCDFKLVVIGAEIDDESESLWVWLDDPENPL